MDEVELHRLLEEYERAEKEVEELKKAVRESGNTDAQTKQRIRDLLIAIMRRNERAKDLENALRQILGLDGMGVDVMIEEVWWKCARAKYETFGRR